MANGPGRLKGRCGADQGLARNRFVSSALNLEALTVVELLKAMAPISYAMMRARAPVEIALELSKSHTDHFSPRRRCAGRACRRPFKASSPTVSRCASCSTSTLTR